VAIVTGANHGIGAATAKALAAQGAAVVLNYLRIDEPPTNVLPEAYRAARAEDASPVVDDIVAEGGFALGVEADLTLPETPAVLFDAAEASLGPVDILVNNASNWAADTFGDGDHDRMQRKLSPVSAESFDRPFAVDARASALMIGEYARRHRAHGLTWGRIIGLTSGGPMGFPEEVSYGAAKAAMENLTMSAAFELAGRGITANVVHPPVTDTGWIDEAVRRQVAEDRSLFNIAEPEDVAAVIVLLFRRGPSGQRQPDPSSLADRTRGQGNGLSPTAPPRRRGL
jgi:3-oxoacyl-[acyl-carrier protein] reductase